MISLIKPLYISYDQSLASLEGLSVGSGLSQKENSCEGTKNNSSNKDDTSGFTLKNPYPYEIQKEQQDGQHSQELQSGKEGSTLLFFPNARNKKAQTDK